MRIIECTLATEQHEKYTAKVEETLSELESVDAFLKKSAGVNTKVAKGIKAKLIVTKHKLISKLEDYSYKKEYYRGRINGY